MTAKAKSSLQVMLAQKKRIRELELACEKLDDELKSVLRQHALLGMECNALRKEKLAADPFAGLVSAEGILDGGRRTLDSLGGLLEVALSQQDLAKFPIGCAVRVTLLAPKGSKP